MAALHTAHCMYYRVCSLQVGSLVQGLMAQHHLMQSACQAAPPLTTDADSCRALWRSCSGPVVTVQLGKIPAKHCNRLESAAWLVYLHEDCYVAPAGMAMHLCKNCSLLSLTLSIEPAFTGVGMA